MSVLLGQSYYLRFDPTLWEAMQPYPPLGTLYAASVLRERGHQVALFDAMLAASEDAWRVALVRTAPRHAVIFEDSFNYLSKMCLLRMREAALAMIDMARRAGCHVIVSGSDASDHPDVYLARGADFVIVGEGDETLADLIDRLEGYAAGSPRDVMGVAHLGSDGAVRRTPARPVIRDLDRLPFPAWDLVDVSAYRARWRARHGYHSMNMVTTRGCPYHCNWCAKPVWGQQSHTRSPEHVVRELAWLKRTYQPDHIWFADDIFGLTPGWLSHFADEVVRQDARLPFKCLSRADLLARDGEVEALKAAGCQIVWVGAESGSQRILDAMEKGTRVDQIVEAARRLHDASIQVGFFLQFGYPGETLEDIAATLDLVRLAHPDDIGVSVSYPLPGTPFHRRVQATLGARQNWVDSSDLAMLYRGPFSTTFYRQLHRVLHTEFRARRAWRQLRGAATSAAAPQPGWRPSMHSGRTLRRLVHLVAAQARLVMLPYARHRLDRLASASAGDVGPLPVALTREEAARPTPPEGKF